MVLKIPGFGTSQNIAGLSERGQKRSRAALCGAAGACDVVVRFNLAEKTMFRPPKHRFTGPGEKFRESRVMAELTEVRFEFL